MFTAAAGFTQTTITVETYAGESARGRVFAAPVQRSVFLSQSRTQVRNSSGELTLSQSTVYDVPDAASLYTPESRITLPGQKTIVLTISVNVIGEPDVDHVKVALQ